MFWDSEENNNIENTGSVNNNVVLEIKKEEDDYASGLVILIAIIGVIKIFEVLCFRRRKFR